MGKTYFWVRIIYLSSSNDDEYYKSYKFKAYSHSADMTDVISMAKKIGRDGFAMSSSDSVVFVPAHAVRRVIVDKNLMEEETLDEDQE